MYQTKEVVIQLFENMDKAVVAYNYIFKIILFFIKHKRIEILIAEILHSGDVTIGYCSWFITKLRYASKITGDTEFGLMRPAKFR